MKKFIFIFLSLVIMMSSVVVYYATNDLQDEQGVDNSVVGADDEQSVGDSVVDLEDEQNIDYIMNGLDDEQNIKSILDKFFDSYFRSQMTFIQEDLNDIVEENDQTIIFKKMVEVSLDLNEKSGYNVSKYKFNLTFSEFDINDSFANVKLYLTADIYYERSGDLRSGIANIPYEFQLTKDKEHNWKIVSIYTPDDVYVNFEKTVNDEIKFNSRSKSDKNIKQVVSEIADVKKEENQEIVDWISNLNQEPESDISMEPSIEPFAAAYSYSATNGVKYAGVYAESQNSSRIFYTAGSDCTNFVSQCVWAAYGAWVQNDINLCISNRNNKVRMDSSNWYGGSGGGSSAWESVESFWSYATKSKSVGPVGTGSNNNALYTSLSGIKVGDVLQARNGSTGNYGHSVYVTYVSGSDIRVSQHSFEKYDRTITDFLSGWGGTSSCYMRKISFSTANFNS